MVAYTHYRTDPRCRREATLAASAGWAVDFYALSPDGRPRTECLEGVELHELAVERYRGSSSAAYVMSYLRFLALASWAVLGAHLRRPFRIIHVNTMPDFMVLVGLLPRALGAKVLLDIHDVMPEIYMTKFGVSAAHWKIKLIKGMEVASASLAHRVLTAEHPKLELLVRHGVPRDKLQVLLNLPDDAIFRLQCRLPEPAYTGPGGPASECEFRLIYHGTLAHRLGLDQAIAAVAQLAPTWPGLRLRIYGEGDHLPSLRAQADALGVGERVWFSGRYQPIEEIVPDICEAHLAVLPTRPGPSTDYMLPTKLLEYLSFGIPAVVTPTLTVRHYCGEKHPLYLEDPSPALLAAKLVWARQNYGEAVRLARELQEHVFTCWRWSEHKRTYLELLDRLAP